MNQIPASDLMTEALARCASEPIHCPGSIQPFGYLLVISPDGTINQCSENSIEVLGHNPLGKRYNDILPASIHPPIEKLLTRISLSIAEIPSIIIGADSVKKRTARIYRESDLVLVEILSEAEDDGDESIDCVVEQQLILSRGISLLPNSTVEQTAMFLVKEVQEILGYDRVMVYRFDSEWNGQVIAEASIDNTDTYLGLWFPASDIPPQARELYKRNSLRVLADVTAREVPLVPSINPYTNQPLDLTQSLTRNFSAVHREYLKNMRVQASLVVSILCNGDLWGLLTCHHRTSKIPSSKAKTFVRTVAELFQIHIILADAREHKEGTAKAQEMLSELKAILATKHDWKKGLILPDTGLMEILEADGLAVAGYSEVIARGITPKQEEVQAICDWLVTTNQQSFQTDRLGHVAPQFAHLAENASGIVALRVPGENQSWVIWFRREFHLSVHWAGEPQKGLVIEDGIARLTPRHSFSVWKEEVRGRSRSWSPVRLVLAREFVKANLLDVLVQWHQNNSARLERMRGILFAQVDDAVFITDLEGILTFWNDGAQRLLGWTREEVIGKPLIQLFPDTEKNRIQVWLRGVLSGKEYAGESKEYTKHNTPIWIDCRIRVVKGENGLPAAVVGVARNITQRKETDRALRKSEARYRILTENSRDVIARLDRESTILDISQSCGSLLGFQSEELLGKQWNTLVHPDHRLAYDQFHQSALSFAGLSNLLAYKITRADNIAIWVEGNSRVLHESADTNPELICVTRCIEERMQQEEYHRQIQKLEAIGQLAGSIAHDFNNLLQLISGYADWGLEQPDQSIDGKTCFQEIKAASDYGTALTKQLLGFTRKQVISLEPVNLNSIIEFRKKMLERLLGEDIRLTVSLSSIPATLVADRTQIDQILLNLAGNARNAMASGGELLLSTEVKLISEKTKELLKLSTRHYVILTVKDTGCGMDAATKTRIFEPFFTTKPVDSSTGLGLATVHSIIVQNKGAIEVESEPGHGTLFRIYWPFSHIAVSTQILGAPKSIPRGTESILVVEDNVKVRVLTSTLLKQQGYRTVEAELPDAAIKIVEKSSVPFDLLVTDVVMPGMNGRELATHLRELQPKLKVLYVSGYSFDTLKQLTINPETEGFLQKPFTPYEMARRVRDLLDRPT